MAEKSGPEKTLDIDLPDDPDDLGEDWESAFDAEDFFIDGTSAVEDFFQADDESGEAFDLAAILEQESAGLTDGASVKPAEKVGEEPTVGAVAALEGPGRFAALSVFFSALGRRYQGLKSYQKIVVAVLPPCLILMVFVLFRSEAPELESVDSSAPEVAEKMVESPAPAPSSPPEPEKSVTKIAGQAKEAAEKPAAARVMLRKKWPFPSFFIASEQEDGKEAVFVAIDLTLITLLPQGTVLPVEKETFVRNMIYQFYVNQPAYELNRYSLARGEMIQRLRSWIAMQWPDSPIETIAFNRYQVLK